MNNRIGRPTKYDVSMNERAYELCKECGLTDKQLARAFGVAPSKIYDWKNKFPEFRESIKAGKEIFDFGRVEKAFLQRALGFRYTEVTKERDKDGNMNTTKQVRKQIPPDAKACMDWLCNRNPDRWRKVKHVELSGPDGGDIGVKADPWKVIMDEVSKNNSDELPNRTQRKIGD